MDSEKVSSKIADTKKNWGAEGAFSRFSNLFMYRSRIQLITPAKMDLGRANLKPA